MHGRPTARTEDFRQYGFIHMEMGLRGQGSHVHERSRARAAAGAGCDRAEPGCRSEYIVLHQKIDTNYRCSEVNRYIK